MEILPEIDWNSLDIPFWYERMVLKHAPEAWYKGGPPYWWHLLRDGKPLEQVIAFGGNGFAIRTFPHIVKEGLDRQ